MPAVHASNNPAVTPVPGQWFLRLHHASLGAVHDFSCVNEPTIEFNDAGTALTIVVDENTFVVGTHGLQLLWKFLVPDAPELASTASDSGDGR